MMVTDPTSRFILTLSCPSGPSQVAAISAFLDGLGGYIEELSVFDDERRKPDVYQHCGTF